MIYRYDIFNENLPDSACCRVISFILLYIYIAFDLYNCLQSYKSKAIE